MSTRQVDRDLNLLSAVSVCDTPRASLLYTALLFKGWCQSNHKWITCLKADYALMPNLKRDNFMVKWRSLSWPTWCNWGVIKLAWSLQVGCGGLLVTTSLLRNKQSGSVRPRTAPLWLLGQGYSLVLVWLHLFWQRTLCAQLVTGWGQEMHHFG